MKNILIIEPVSSGLLYLTIQSQLENILKERVNLHVFISVENNEISIEQLACQVSSYRVINLRDTDLVCQKAKEIDCDAVLAGFEFVVPLVNKVCHSLGLPHHSEKTIECVRNKHYFRRTITKAGLSNISFARLAHGITTPPYKFPFPAIIKPSDMAGSMGVVKVDTEQQALSALSQINSKTIGDIGYTASGDVSIEEYIEGKEYSVEGVVQPSGEVFIASITDKLLSPEPYFVEIGHIVNRNYDAVFIQTVEKYTKDVIGAIEMGYGVFHLELRITPSGTPVAIEIAARLAGCRIIELIHLAKGIDLSVASAMIALGFNANTVQTNNEVAAIAYVAESNSLIFHCIHNENKVTKHPYFIKSHRFLEQGEEINNHHDFSNYIAEYVFKGEKEAEIKRLTDLVFSELKAS